MFDAPHLADAPVPTARVLAEAIIAARAAAADPTGPAAAPRVLAGCAPDDVQATVAALLVRYSEVMARLADV